MILRRLKLENFKNQYFLRIITNFKMKLNRLVLYDRIARNYENYPRSLDLLRERCTGYSVEMIEAFSRKSEAAREKRDKNGIKGTIDLLLNDIEGLRLFVVENDNKPARKRGARNRNGP